MKRLLLSLLLLLPLPALSQNLFLCESVDREADSIAVVAMQEKMRQIRKTRPTVAVVLSGGGAKGASHVGVLRYLEENGIPVDMITGTSMGGLIGGLYSLGYGAPQLDSLLKSIDWSLMMSDEVDAKYSKYENFTRRGRYLFHIPFSSENTSRSLPDGFLEGVNVHNTLSSLSVGYQDSLDFSQLPIPFFCVSTDLVSLKEVNWTRGTIADAMRSTMAIPVVFKPVRRDGMVLVDGGTRNNFPVDLARVMGADIVIGVDLHMPSSSESVGNVVDIVTEGLCTAGSDTYSINVQDVDLYLHPDMTGYDMMSFGKEEIADIIDKGYEEALGHAEEFRALAARTGAPGRALQAPPALDISTSPVRIKSVDIEGVEEDEKLILLGRLTMKEGEEYDGEDFARAVAILRSLGTFERVTYRISGKEAPYDCVFVCRKSSSNSLSIGLRLDSEEIISALVNFGLRRNDLTGHKFDATLKVSTCPSLDLVYTYVPALGPIVGASLSTQYRHLGPSFSANRYSLDFWHNELGVFLQNNWVNNLDLKLGARIQDTPYGLMNGESSTDWGSFYSYVFLKGRYSSLNDNYFPERGVNVALSYDALLYGYDATARRACANTHFVAFDALVPINCCKWLCIIPSVAGRFIFGNPNSDGYMDNFVGGMLPGRYVDHQIAYVGVDKMEMMGNILLKGNLEIRCKVKKNHYISAILACAGGASIFEEIGGSRCAAALQYALRTKFGPLMVNVHWDSKQNAVGAYLGFGYNF